MNRGRDSAPWGERVFAESPACYLCRSCSFLCSGSKREAAAALAVGTSPPRFSSPPETKPRSAGQALSPDFICLPAWRAAIQLAHEMGCSSSPCSVLHPPNRI